MIRIYIAYIIKHIFGKIFANPNFEQVCHHKPAKGEGRKQRDKNIFKINRSTYVHATDSNPEFHHLTVVG